MNKVEAIHKMMSGDKITHKYWVKGTYVWFDFIEGIFVEEDNTPIDMNDLNDMNHSAGFMIYKEPVIKYYWVVLCGDVSRPSITSKMYENEEQLLKNLSVAWAEKIERTAKEFYDE